MNNSLSKSKAFEGLSYTQADLQNQMRIHYEKIIDFITSPNFTFLMEEMSKISYLERPKFVQDVLLNDIELNKRGVQVPEGILIQRSAFGDRRPTLFAVKHFLPPEYSDVWQNVNITFDNECIDIEISRAKTACWREPLPPGIQALAMSKGKKLEEI